MFVQCYILFYNHIHIGTVVYNNYKNKSSTILKFPLDYDKQFIRN